MKNKKLPRLLWTRKPITHIVDNKKRKENKYKCRKNDVNKEV